MNLKLETALRDVPGIGTARLAHLGKLRLHTVSDLLLHRPRRYEDRRHPATVAQAVKGEHLLVRGRITAHGVNQFRRGAKSVYEFVLEDGTGRLHCRYWNQPYLQSQFGVGLELFVYGRITGLKPTVMENPETELIQLEEEALIHLNRIVPIHRLTEGLTPRWLRQLIWRVLAGVEIPESADERLASTRSGATRLDQFRRLHFPASEPEIEQSRRHFALEELLSLQRGFASRRNAFRSRAQGHPCAGDNRLIKPFLKQLDFRLTDAQTRVLREIRADLQRPFPMRRLLHGDVGAGKTVVAACAALMALESGFGVALMAPTEILAEQHYAGLHEWLAGLGVPVALHTGKFRAAENAGHPALTIGTHALIHEGYQPERLGLVIIDEQHRFGVVQREKLVRKGAYPHLLVMTATPIPRTLGLTAYGDLDISVLDELPARRGQIRTHLRTTAELPKIWRFVQDQLAAGRQAYVVYPRIEEDVSQAELKSVIEEHNRLSELLKPFQAGLLHGRLETRQSQRIMADFRANRLQVLAATTVIEVGLDVPNATVMVIENAGQYGLSQLHQLRGRIGRGAADAHCILVEDSRKADALERLKVMLKTNDGFVIAEEDLRLRGVGDFLGTRQSGLPKMKFGDLVKDRDLVELARELVEQNPR
jgi:ATP-dependent DNA helicase RecG